MRRKEMTSSSTDDHQILNHPPQYLENLAPRLFDRSQISADDQEEWDDEYHHATQPHDPTPEKHWFQVADHGDYNRLIRLKRKRKGKRNWRASAIADITRPNIKRTSKSKLDRIRKFCDTPQVVYPIPSRQGIFEMLSKRYEEMNILAELQIKKLQAGILQRQEWISKLHKTFSVEPLLVETSAKTPAPRLVLPTDENWESCAEEANRKMQEGILLMERLKDANLIP